MNIEERLKTLINSLDISEDRKRNLVMEVDTGVYEVIIEKIRILIGQLEVQYSAEAVALEKELGELEIAIKSETQQGLQAEKEKELEKARNLLKNL